MLTSILGKKMRKNGQDHRVLMDHKLINVPQGKSGDAH